MSERLCILCGNRWIADGLCHDDYDERDHDPKPVHDGRAIEGREADLEASRWEMGLPWNR